MFDGDRKVFGNLERARRRRCRRRRRRRCRCSHRRNRPKLTAFKTVSAKTVSR